MQGVEARHAGQLLLSRILLKLVNQSSIFPPPPLRDVVAEESTLPKSCSETVSVADTICE